MQNDEVTTTARAFPDDRGATWVLLTDEEAKRRNFRNALAFKRWCYRAGVPVRKIGQWLFIRPMDVDAAIANAPLARTSSPSPSATPMRSAIADAVAAMTGRK